MVQIANKTVKNYLSSLNENEKIKLESILSESDEKLTLKYEIIKEDVVDKLNDLKSKETDNDIKSKITETITKVKNEKYDKLNYFKLQELNRNI
jgi:ribosomal protein S17E